MRTKSVRKNYDYLYMIFGLIWRLLVYDFWTLLVYDFWILLVYEFWSKKLDVYKKR